MSLHRARLSPGLAVDVAISSRRAEASVLCWIAHEIPIAMRWSRRDRVDARLIIAPEGASVRSPIDDELEVAAFVPVSVRDPLFCAFATSCSSHFADAPRECAQSSPQRLADDGIGGEILGAW